MFQDEKKRVEFLKMVKQVAEGQDEDLMPTMIADLDGQMSICSVPFGGPKDKDAFREMLGNLIANSRITWFGLVFESWTCKAVKEEDYDRIMAMPAKDRPGAKEVIFVTIGSPKIELQYMAELHRIRGKRVIGEWESLGGSNLISGRFAHIWKNSVAVNN